MGIQMMGGNPLESFQTGYNLGNKPNAIGTAILGVMDRYQQKQTMDQELGNKLKLAQWESKNITGPADTAKFEREKGWEREKMGIEGKNKLKEIMLKNTFAQKSAKKLGDMDLKVWKQAEDEVTTSLGGSAMVGIDEESRAQYYPQIMGRYLELKRQFNPIGGATTPSANPMPQSTSKIRVKRIADGQTGTIDANEFNPNIYNKI
jgi:hypothetical protein